MGLDIGSRRFGRTPTRAVRPVLQFKDKQMKKDVQRIEKRLKQLGEKGVLTKAKQRKISKGASKLVRDQLRIDAPVLKDSSVAFYVAAQGKAEHYRYKGGRRVATYTRGNLSRSMKDFSFRRSRFMHVGPKNDLAMGGAGGYYSSKQKADGFYAGFVNWGTQRHDVTIWPYGNRHARRTVKTGQTATHFMDKSIRKSSARAINRIKRDFRIELPKMIQAAKSKVP